MENQSEGEKYKQRMSHKLHFFLLERRLFFSVFSPAKRLQNFTVGIGDQADVTTHSQCAYYNGFIPNGQHRTLDCTSPISGRYVSVLNGKPADYKKFSLCEVVVMGYEVIGKCVDNHSLKSPVNIPDIPMAVSHILLVNKNYVRRLSMAFYPSQSFSFE